MQLWQELRSHLHYKIILPFLLLTLLVALAGSAASFLLIVGNTQSQLDAQLAQVIRTTNDNLISLENANLAFLREVAFAPANQQTGAPSVIDALSEGSSPRLFQALDPYFRVSTQRNVRIDRLIAFDQTRRSLIDWEYEVQDDRLVRIHHKASDVSNLWFVSRILSAQYDAVGDKYAGLVLLPSTGSAHRQYLFTVVPVTSQGQVVGGLVAALRLDNLLQQLSARTQASLVTLYEANEGQAFASSTQPAVGLAELNIRSELMPGIRELSNEQPRGIFDVRTVNSKSYQFAYAPLRIRNAVVGVISVALPSDYVTGPWAAARVPLIGMTLILVLMIIGLGVFITRQITHPLQEMVATAQAVAAGDLERRSAVAASDEIGALSLSFNDMTEHLMALYCVMRAESGQRAAVIENVSDGVIVCDPNGVIQLLNRAARSLLKLEEHQNGPQRFEDLPFRPLTVAPLAFGGQVSSDLFALHDAVVRVRVTPLLDDDGTQLGTVSVLQDMTQEVTVDRAKTKFISAISHALRTPLTVLGSNTDLLLREVAGPLNQEQRKLLQAMRKHALGMSALLSNIITIADIESGALPFEPLPLNLGQLLDGLTRPLRAVLAVKGVELAVAVPHDLPPVLADEQLLRNVMYQLLDNAQRHTSTGTVIIYAFRQDTMVRVDIRDTGSGINPDLRPYLFERFTRGTEQRSSTERGFGLGLAIARQLVERQGGRIWLEQTSPRGSTFSFTLPCVHETIQHIPSFASAA